MFDLVDCQEDGFKHGEEEVGAIGFFGIQSERYVGVVRSPDERGEAWNEFVLDSIFFAEFVSRVDGGELDGDSAVVVRRGCFGGKRFQACDGVVVGFQIELCVAVASRGFAEHVVGESVSLFSWGLCAFDGFVHAFAKHELSSHEFHGFGDGCSHDGFAESLDEFLHRSDDPLPVLEVFENVSCEHEAPVRRAEEEGCMVCFVFAPCFACDLVLDEVVERGCIGSSEVGFGEAHESCTLS